LGAGVDVGPGTIVAVEGAGDPMLGRVVSGVAGPPVASGDDGGGTTKGLEHAASADATTAIRKKWRSDGKEARPFVLMVPRLGTR
jgi:hypothetical protein